MAATISPVISVEFRSTPWLPSPLANVLLAASPLRSSAGIAGKHLSIFEIATAITGALLLSVGLRLLRRDLFLYLNV